MQNQAGILCDHSVGLNILGLGKERPYQHTEPLVLELGVAFTGFIQAKKELQKFGRLIVDTKRYEFVTVHTPLSHEVFWHEYAKSRDIQSKIPLPQAIWNNFGYVTVNGVNK